VNLTNSDTVKESFKLRIKLRESRKAEVEENGQRHDITSKRGLIATVGIEGLAECADRSLSQLFAGPLSQTPAISYCYHAFEVQSLAKSASPQKCSQNFCVTSCQVLQS